MISKSSNIKKHILGSLMLLLAWACLQAVAEQPVTVNAFSVTSQSSRSLDIRFSLPPFQMNQLRHAEMDFQRISIEGAINLSQVGMPELPLLSTLVAIPNQGGVQVECISSRAHTIQGIIPYPAQEEDAKTFAINADYYAGRQALSTSFWHQGEPVIMRDFRLIAVQVQPFIWDASLRQMRVYDELQLRVSFNDQPGINELPDVPRVISPAFDKQYSGLILNYDDFRHEVAINQAPRILIIHGNYSNSVFQNQIDEFALWKRQKGAEVQVVSTGQIGTSTTLIKSYLQSVYDNVQTRPDYVILVGDVTGNFAIPGWHINGFGDYPYSMLAGNDNLGDVFLGRISAENVAQLGVILAKVYAYEKNLNTNIAQWLNRMLLVADTYHNGMSVKYLSYYIRDLSKFHNPDYTHTMVISDNPSAIDMNTAINQGVGIFNYRGFTGMSGWTAGDDNLNNINKLSHSIIITCNTGNYDQTGFTEQIIRVGTAAAPKGAVTSIGMWGPGTATMPNNALDGAIIDGIFTQEMRTMGEAMLYSKIYFYMLYGISHPQMCVSFTQWMNLMGDPSMEVYITIPDTFSSNAPASVPKGTNTLDVNVTDQNGQLISGACVTLTYVNGSQNTIISRAWTDENGYAYLPFLVDVDEGSLVLTISRHDFKPLQQTIAIGPGSLLAADHIINDDNQGVSSGNGNSVANSGETLEVLFGLRNSSTATISGISGTLSCDDPRVSISNPDLSFADMAPHTMGYSQTPVVIQISPQMPNNSLIRFVLHLSDTDQNQYTIYDYVSVWDAQLAFDSCQISGENNSVLDPGETAVLKVTLSNLGNIPVTNLSGELFTGNELVLVTDSHGFFGDIGASDSATNQTDSFSLHALSSTIRGMVIPFKLKLTNPQGFLQWVHFSLTVGTITVNDPLGPDAYGYLIYDDTDTSYDECPVYNWIGIAPAEGGNGIALDISDPPAASEGDDVASTALQVVDLPFSFRFYAQDYDQITVCSNGFIAFGVTQNGGFRNYRLPGPMGPAPMVAAFWDDLATGPQSGIYTWYDAQNHRFIIEWYQMLNGFLNQYTETFQIILYDPLHYPTSLGDGPIKIQYHTFFNVDSGSTDQTHGNYCTVGIQNTDRRIGLEYTYSSVYPRAASPLSQNRALYISTVPVNHDSPWLVPGQIVVNDQNNGVAEPGETIELGVILENMGNRPAMDVSAGISSLDPYVTIINASSEYYPIGGHAQGSNKTPFTISISPSCPDGHSILFAMQISIDGNSWIRSFSLPVQTGKLILESRFFNDVFGNNNGYADAGENFLLILNVLNPSELPVLNLQGQLSSSSQNISISSPVITMPVLEGGKTTQFVYELSFDDGTPANSMSMVDFELSSDNAPALNVPIELGCGQLGMYSDFEGDNGGFTPRGGWVWGSPTQIMAHSGNKVWATALSGQYVNGGDYSLLTPVMNVGVGAQLSFWHQLFSQAGQDGGNVAISTNNGANWTVINPSGGGGYQGNVASLNGPGFSGTISAWSKVTFDLSAYANTPIRIRWKFTSNDSVTNYGWFIDDVTVSGYSIRTGMINGIVSLSDGGEAVSATVSAPYLGSTIQVHPETNGFYNIFLPFGSYQVTASKPYYESSASPSLTISNSIMAHMQNFALNYLPPVTDFTLSYNSESAVVSLSWTAPQAPVHPVLTYRIMRKFGPGIFEEIGETGLENFEENLDLIGTYLYYVCPVYAAGEGAPSQLQELVITGDVANEDPVSIPAFALRANYPNPFNPSTTIPFALAKSSHVQLCIYNLRGQLVKTLVNSSLPQGEHRLSWDGKDNAGKAVASGIYLYRLQAPAFIQTRKMILIK